MDKKKYKTKFKDKLVIEALGWTWLIFLVAGIWYTPLRWRLIFTSFLAIFLAIILTSVEKDREKKFNESLDKKGERKWIII